MAALAGSRIANRHRWAAIRWSDGLGDFPVAKETKSKAFRRILILQQHVQRLTQFVCNCEADTALEIPSPRPVFYHPWTPLYNARQVCGELPAYAVQVG